jgi:hypothetical protein
MTEETTRPPSDISSVNPGDPCHIQALTSDGQKAYVQYMHLGNTIAWRQVLPNGASQAIAPPPAHPNVYFTNLTYMAQAVVVNWYNTYCNEMGVADTK